MMQIAILTISVLFFSGCQSTKEKQVSDFKDTGITPTHLVQQEIAYPDSGRYIGFVKLSATQTKLPMLLDVMLTSVVGAELRYQGVSRINMTGLSSHEYVSSYFPKIEFAGPGASWNFGKGNQFQISDVSFASGKVSGNLSDAKSEFTGEFELVRQVKMNEAALPTDKIFPKFDLQGGLTGNYKGVCDDQPVSMQVESFKGWHTRDRENHPMTGYRIIGRFGKVDKVLCSSSAPCTKENYLSAKYNFYTGKLDLKAPRITKNCQVDNGVVECGECQMSRASQSPNQMLYTSAPYATFPRQFTLPQMKDAQNPRYLGTNVPSLVMGQYYGYLHHEANDSYQLLALNVKAKESSYPKNPVRLETVATLYLGEGDSSEFIAHKFGTATFPSSENYLVLNGPGEGFFAITEWRKETVAGVWFSKTRGRIGTVELQRDLVPVLAEKFKTLEPISGAFEGDNWIYELSAAADISETETDFFPMRVYGWAKEKRPGSRRRMIEGGAFDYFTGALAFEMDDRRIVVGRVSAGGGMDLFWPPRPRYGLAMDDHTPASFRRISEDELRHALLQRKK